MGCNGSKSVAAALAEAEAPPAATEGDEATATPPTEDAAVTRPVTPAPVPPSMAFDIPFDDNTPEDGSSGGGESIVKRHPPRRLQRLEEQQQLQEARISLQELQDKQAEAEQRRLQFLQLRAQSAKRKYAMRNNNTIPAKPVEDDVETVELEAEEQPEEAVQ